MCTLDNLTNDLIDGGHLSKAKPNYILKTVFSPRLATVYQVIINPRVHVRPRLK